MAGRDIAAGILAVLKKLGVPTGMYPMAQLLTCLDQWESKNVTRYASFGQSDLVDRTHDQAGMIRALAESAESVSDLSDRIDWLFSDDTEDAEQILCSSIHKAKGLEAPRIYLLQESLYRRGTNEAEQNLEYVGITRAMNHLTVVTGIL